MSQVSHSMMSFAIYFACFLTTFTPVFSQSKAAENPPSMDPQPLEIVQIPDFGKNTRTLMTDIQESISNNHHLHEISTGIEDVIKVLDGKSEVLSDTLTLYKIDRLDKEAREISLLNQRVLQWKSTIQNISILGQKKDSVALSMLSIWQLTLKSISSSNQNPSTKKKANEDPNDLITEISNFISDLQSSRNNLHVFLDSIQNIQTEITIAENKLGSITSLIQSSKSQLQQNIWIPESLPIWKAKSDTVSGVSISRFNDFIISDTNIIKAFLKNNPRLLYYLAALIALILGGIIYLKPKAKNLYEDFKEEFTEAKIILDHPFSSALIITWLCTLLFSYFPREFKDFVSLVMLLPLVVMLYKLNPGWKWYTALIFSCSYLLFLIIREIDFSHLTQRIALIGINIGTLGLFIHYNRKAKQANSNTKLWLESYPFVIHLLIVAAVASLIASFVGNVQLSQMLNYVLLGIIVAIYALRTAILLTKSFTFLVLMGPLMQHSYILKEEGRLVLQKMDKAFTMFGYGSLIFIVLELLDIRKEAFDAIMHIVNYPLVVGELSISMGKIFAFFITIQISIWISAFIRYILEKEVFPRTHLKQGVPNTILLMIKFTLIVLGVLFAFSAAGIKMDKLAIAMGALGVGIGFGLQGIISNFISGIILALERPITIGDLIEIPNVSGVVKDIGIRASTVRTWDGSDVIVPNAELISNKLTNWTFYDRLRRVKVDVRVPYDTDIESVSKLLLSAAHAIPEVMKKPKPYLNFIGIGTSAMEITLYCWINDSDKIFSYGTAIRQGVYKALQDAGYDTPLPKQELKIGSKTKDKEI